ncbi:MAG: sulfur oxidation c-type cytochrome SoxX [Pseudomonadales bacterium]|nr:sulfur oxidation c-type cytochrome SoxX [Pseudomonadales bacterium]
MKWLCSLLFLLPGTCAFAGDPEAGKAIALDPDRGDCVICHRLLPDSPEQQGNIGPSLLDVGRRLNREEIHRRVKDARTVNPVTMMPPYGSTEDLHRVAEAFKGKPILTDSEIDDVVAWLMTLQRVSE